ncbi:hypothetical protein [Caulobacter sp. DWR1-3-2b1]|uniref:hypothetical protein n=1 Tax=Caulobacter sp. DWR1-3-2b1 TaxID=2804670 RepID=UPI003CF24EA9
MTEALTDTAGVGALEPKIEKLILEALNLGQFPDIPERVLPYAQLVEAVQEPGRLPWGDVLVFTNEEAEALKKLNFYRELIDHVKPTSWVLAASDLSAAIVGSLSVLPRVIGTAAQRYSVCEVAAVADAVKRTRFALSEGIPRDASPP